MIHVFCILRMGRKGNEGVMEKVNLIKIYCKDICKYHNESLQYNYYMVTIKKKHLTGVKRFALSLPSFINYI
jgi:hypothetical protein